MTDPSAIRKLIEGVTEGLDAIEKALLHDAAPPFDPRGDNRIYQLDGGLLGNALNKARAARTLVPQLLDEVERLTKSRDEWIRDFDTCAKAKEKALGRIAELEAGMGERK